MFSTERPESLSIEVIGDLAIPPLFNFNLRLFENETPMITHNHVTKHSCHHITHMSYITAPLHRPQTF